MHQSQTEKNEGLYATHLSRQTDDDEWIDENGEEHYAFDGYVESLHIGDYDLLAEFKAHEGHYVYLLIDYHAHSPQKHTTEERQGD